MKRHHRKKASKIKAGFSLLLVGLIVLQIFSLTMPAGTVRASENPVGPLKKVIVGFRGESAAAPEAATRQSQVAELSQRRAWLAGALQLSAGYKKITRQYSHIPYVAMNVDSAGEASLRRNPNVTSVVEDRFLKRQEVPWALTPGVLDGDWQTGFSDGSTDYTGAGFTVAILDDGIDKTHPRLAGTVISEACYGENQEYINATVESACPGGATQTTASGAGVPCAAEDCFHGTAVASMVAMQPTEGLVADEDPVEASGVAKDAKLIAIQVNGKVTEKTGQGDICGDAGSETETCFIPLMSLILAGLNRVLELQEGVGGTQVAAANISIGDPANFAENEAVCGVGDPETFEAINQAAAALEAVNIATIAAAGNSGDVPMNANKISVPACLSNVIAVSATTADQHMTTYTNAGPLTNLLAPGGEADPDAPHTDGGILGAVPGETVGDQYMPLQGTSFSSPIVAGAWALVREKAPNASVEGMLQGFQDNGITVTEDREDYTPLAHKLIDIGATLAVADSLPLHSSQQEPPPDTGGPQDTDNTNTTWIPGVPNTGNLNKLRAIAVIGVCLTILYLLYRKNLQRLVHRRA